MSTQVMLALDGSEKDERALAVAAAIVELTGASLQLVRVGDSPVLLLTPASLA